VALSFTGWVTASQGSRRWWVPAPEPPEPLGLDELAEGGNTGRDAGPRDADGSR